MSDSPERLRRSPAPPRGPARAALLLGAALLAGGAQAEVAPRPRPAAPAPAAEPTACGRPDIVAERLPPLADAGGCGLAAPVRVRSIAGVALDPPAVVTCPMAERTREWLVTAAKPAFAADGAPLSGLGVAAAYVCRNVNNAEEGDLSEHAFGRALDVSRFLRADGTVVSVLEGWGAPPHGALLRRVHEAACGVFGTALGPESDPLHVDHLHYDIAARRRPYCPPDDGRAAD